MADTINIQETNEWLSEVQRQARALVDILKAGYETGESGTLGDLALVDVLSDAPVGNAGILRNNLDLGGAARREVFTSRSLDPLDYSEFLPSTSVINECAAANFGSYYSGGSGTNIDNARLGDVGLYSASNPGTFPRGGGGFWWISTQSLYTGTQRMQIAYSYGTKSAQLAIRYGDDSGFGDWRIFWSDKNTTIDSNGFIKAASPIFRLANDANTAATDGFEPADAGAKNSESSGVTATHDDVGVYTVRGALGLHGDGWKVELPRAADGTHECLAATETGNDGTITVRTYAVVIDPRGVEVPGHPMDIPADRWVDLRLCMPAEPTEEDPEPATPTPGPDVVLEFVTPWTYKLDIWERMTDDEAEAFEESFNATSAKNRGLWRDCRYIAHDSPLFDTLRGMMIEQWGEARADELLAPSA